MGRNSAVMGVTMQEMVQLRENAEELKMTNWIVVTNGKKRDADSKI